MAADLLSSPLTSTDLLTPAKNLLIKSFYIPMSEDDIESIKKCIEEDPRVIYNCGLTPERFPNLVENNPSIAVEFLLRLYTTNQMPLYVLFNVLIIIIEFCRIYLFIYYCKL
jgi:hypothetical protein